MRFLIILTDILGEFYVEAKTSIHCPIGPWYPLLATSLRKRMRSLVIFYHSPYIVSFFLLCITKKHLSPPYNFLNRESLQNGASSSDSIDQLQKENCISLSLYIHFLPQCQISNITVKKEALANLLYRHQ